MDFFGMQVRQQYRRSHVFVESDGAVSGHGTENSAIVCFGADLSQCHGSRRSDEFDAGRL